MTSKCTVTASLRVCSAVLELKLLQDAHKLWQTVNQSGVNAVFYQIIKSACRHLISPPLLF